MQLTLPVGPIVPISRSGYGTASAEIEEIRNEEARRQVRDHEYTHVSDTVDGMMDYLNAL